MLNINETTFNLLKERFPDDQMEPYYPSGSWQTSRYIQIFIPRMDENIHYEYRIDHEWKGRMELHFEGESNERGRMLIDNLMNLTQNNDNLIWFPWHESGYCCQLSRKIDAIEDLFQALTVIKEVFDPKINEFNSSLSNTSLTEIPVVNSLNNQSGAVDLHEMTLEEVLQLPLAIPNYQRIYCWEKENVKCLIDDIFLYFENAKDSDIPYILGTIILHSHDGIYDIIDGQQRLVTLSLLLHELGVNAHLLNEKFSSKQSLKYIAYNKYLINKYLRPRLTTAGNARKSILSKIKFSVLVLKNTTIDLAYSFFSNQNSRGVSLTDYDLLKAHHLRYIPTAFEHQSMRAAEVWNTMIENGRPVVDNDSDNLPPDYVTTLDTYIYRLRKWMRKKECDDSTDNYRIKREYEAAPIIDEIPPFGERFYFNEPIQGGSHFFSYVEQHLNIYHQFTGTEEYQALHNHMQGGSSLWYRDVIEAILFGYYLKFGNYYLADALMVIMRIVLQHRYDNGRAYKYSIVQYAGDTELVLIIDQATSPTFFLAEARNIAKELFFPMHQDMKPIMSRMKNMAAAISKRLNGKIVVESFKNINK